MESDIACNTLSRKNAFIVRHRGLRSDGISLADGISQHISSSSCPKGNPIKPRDSGHMRVTQLCHSLLFTDARHTMHDNNYDADLIIIVIAREGVRTYVYNSH